MASKEAPQVEDSAELYGLNPGDFVAARDALARRMRSEGERERAGEIKALRKPSVPAAAVNRAVRADADLAAAAVAAGESLGLAQVAAIEDGDASALREAMRAETDAVEALVELVAREAGLTGTMLDRARDTIRAAARSADLRDEFLGARMTRDAEAIGFGGELVQADPPRRAEPGPRPKRGSGSSKRPRPRSGEDAESKPSAAERRRAERAVSRAESAVEKDERKVSEAATAVEELERRAADAGAAAESARRELAAAEQALARSERDRDRGAEHLTQTQGSAAERRDELDRARTALADLDAT